MKKVRFQLSVTQRILIASFLTFALVLFCAAIPLSQSIEKIEVVQGNAVLPFYDADVTRYSLEGEWILAREAGERMYQKVPSVAWEEGSGTYTLHLNVPESEAGFPLELFTRNMGTSGVVYINGEYIGEQGTYSESEEKAEASALAEIYPFVPRAGDNLIEIRVSNYTHPRAGLWEQVLIARSPDLENMYERQVTVDILLFGITMFIVLYIIAMALQLKEYSLLYFAAAVFFVALGNSTRYTFSIYRLLPAIDYVFVKKASLAFYLFGGGYIAKSFAADLLRNRRNLLINIMFHISIFAGILILILPFKTGYRISIISFPFLLIVFSVFIIKQYQSMFTYFSLNSFWWAFPRLCIQILLLYGTAHDSYTFVTGRYETDMLPYMSTIYAVIYSLLLVQTILEDRRRLERAKSQIITTADRTRESLRNSLHDNLGQMTHGLEFLSESMVRSGKVDPDRIQLINETARDINRELRSLLGDLSPSRLDSLGFEKAVEKMVEQNSNMYETPIELNMRDVDFPLWSATAEQLYLVIRESLTNALRHAKPTKVSVNLVLNKGFYVLEIVNNGLTDVPFIPKTVKGHGIDIMRYRMESLGGTMFVHAEKGGLFRVHAEIPREEI